ncbi:DUF2796 domain-containing protein [Propionivibrio sp.]|uniref:DUF2796 domain-containing protein n=1 Tax=Propionivibrio sp. TaxID=2212460 RepID=UPI0039E66B35
MNSYLPCRRFVVRAVGAAAMLMMLGTGNAQQHAHTHGRVELDVAIDTQAITLQIESPLDNFLGFERAPRTDAERKRVADMVARLNAADRLFQPDPGAECKLAKVDIESTVLDLGGAKKEEDHHHAHDGHDKKDDGGHEHADIDVTVVFACAKAAAARFIDVKLFDAFKGIRTIDAQVAAPQGQFKHSLKPGSSRIQWGR